MNPCRRRENMQVVNYGGNIGISCEAKFWVICLEKVHFLIYRENIAEGRMFYMQGGVFLL